MLGQRGRSWINYKQHCNNRGSKFLVWLIKTYVLISLRILYSSIFNVSVKYENIPSVQNTTFPKYARRLPKCLDLVNRSTDCDTGQALCWHLVLVLFSMSEWSTYQHNSHLTRLMPGQRHKRWTNSITKYWVIVSFFLLVVYALL